MSGVVNASSPRLQGDDAVVEDFIAQWLQREPAMRLALGFLPAASRRTWAIWGALLMQWRESLFSLSTAELRVAKSAWWAQECWGRAKGMSRHPLSAALPEQLEWQALADGIERAMADIERSGEWRTHHEALGSLGRAIARSEARLAGIAMDDDTIEQSASSLISHCLLHRLPAGLARPDRAGIPLQWLARHPDAPLEGDAALNSALIRDWAGHILSQSPDSSLGCRFRRQRHAIDRILLQRLVAGRGFAEPTGYGTLFTLWKHARRSPA